MTTITLHLSTILRRSLGTALKHVPATVDLAEILDCNDLNEIPVDVHDWLARNRQVAFIWSAQDVLERRPDLTEEDAWEVLQNVSRQHDGNEGVSWETLDAAAEALFGPLNAGRQARCEHTVRFYGGNAPDTNVVELLADLMVWCKTKGYSFAEQLRVAEKQNAATLGTEEA